MTTIREYVSKFSYENDAQALAGIERSTVAAFAAVAAAAAAVGAGIQQARRMAQESAQLADDSRKLGQRIGFTTEQIQELDFALGISGTSISEQRGSLVRMARAARDASEGVTTYKEAFDALGVSVTNVDGELKQSPELLLELADAFAAMPDGIEKTALAAEVFGRQGTNMIQFLNLGAEGARELMAEASALGGVMSDEAAQKAELYNDTMLRLQTGIKGVRNEVAGILIPLFSDGAQRRLDMLMRNRELVSEALRVSFRSILGAADFLLTAFERVGDAVAGAIRWMGGFAQVATLVSFILSSLAVTVIGTLVRGAIVSLISWLATATAGLTAAGVATMAWNAALAALPLVIGALIVLFALFVDDVRRFLEGEDSAIGRLAERWIADGEGMFATLGRFLFDLRDNWEIGLTMMRDDWGYTVDRMQSWFLRFSLRVQLAMAEIREGALDTHNAIAEALGMEVLTENIITPEGDRLVDSLREQLDAEISANASVIANRTQERMTLAADLREDRDMRRVQVDASGDTVINVTAGSGDPNAIASEIDRRIRQRDTERAGELSRALGQGAR